ncbi:hypothetical protein GCM10023196_004430 [Actinoallomurus vinaceus]|uniref:Uncharacterized protein n=1 Tax=Actinoallomurus vinaceus TaxID=1080074 RepID=A0ABP8TZQ3_9ACTN
MALSVSLVIVLGALVYGLYRYAGLRAWHAIVCTLFGFYLASTSLAPQIRQGVRSFAHFLSGIKL